MKVKPNKQRQKKAFNFEFIGGTRIDMEDEVYEFVNRVLNAAVSHSLHLSQILSAQF